MDFNKIFAEQARLDAILGGKSLPAFSKEKLIVAALVELGELGNESKNFKYWLKSPSVDRAKLLEEYADAIHFLSSIANDLALESKIEPLFADGDINSQMLMTFAAVVLLKYNYDKSQLYQAFAFLLGLGKLLNISNQDLSEAYFRKVAINKERFASNY